MDNQVRNVQKHCLLILKEVIRICELKNIQYYLVGGSALGAYRHQGFIPWDDDIDIAIPRSQYQMFLEACLNNLGQQFYLQDYYVNEQFIFPFAKIRLNNTAYVDNDLAHIDMHHGIYIDIFPLDNIPNSKFGKFFQKNGLKLCNAIRMAKLNLKSPSTLKNTILFFLKYLFPYKYLPTLYSYFMQISQYKKTTHIGNVVGAYIYEKECIHAKIFGEGKILEFENVKCSVPEEIELFLSEIYGEEYMELPPVNERKTHNPRFISFNENYKHRGNE
ncbi:LicD family protein [Solibacillus sp. CAU 1738]|uniref:LicD family protein n=1 Tax=Solibacillus sp. CAU 1738 TaxID=3140363 RepID=UPI003261B2BA